MCKKLFYTLFLFSFFPFATNAISFDGIIANPANPNPANELSKQWFIYELNAGDSKNDAILIKNTSDKPIQVNLYAVDSTVNEVGGLALENKEDSKDEIGKWVSLTQSQINLAAYEEKRVGFTFNVPSSADIGQYYGGIVIETNNAQIQQLQASGIHVPTRSAIRIYQTVPGTQKKSLIMNSVSRNGIWDTSSFNYKQRFQYQITNTGNANTKADLNITLHNYLFNLGNSEIKKEIVIPKSENLTQSIDAEIPKIGYFKSDITLTYEDEFGKKVEISSSPMMFISFPWIESIIILTVLFFIVFTCTLRKLFLSLKRKRLAIYEVQEGDTILDVQEKTHTHWKKIAFYNQLKKPFVLTPKTALYVHCPDEGQEIDVEDENSDDYETKQDVKTAVYDSTEVTDITEINENEELKKKTTPASHFWIKLFIVFLSILFILSFALLAFFYYQNKQISFSLQQLDTNETKPAYEPDLTVSETPQIKEDLPIDSEKEELEEEKKEEPEIIIHKNEITIHILNGTILKGKAAKLQNALKEEGYTVGSIGNAPIRNNDYTAISYPQELEKHAETVKESLENIGITSELLLMQKSTNYLTITIGKEGLSDF